MKYSLHRNGTTVLKIGMVDNMFTTLRNIRRSTVATLLACSILLAGCGGGGGGSGSPASTSPPPAGGVAAPADTPTTDDKTAARASQLKMVFTADTGQLLMSWTDSFANESGYRIERRTGTDAWQAQESLPAADATGSQLQWRRVIDSRATYRVIALRGSYVVPLEASPEHSEIAIGPEDSEVTLAIDQDEPVHGTAQISVQGATNVQSVSYFVNLSSIGSSTSAPAFAASWDSRNLPDGEHLLIAHVQESSGAIIELRRTVMVDNPNVAVSLSTTTSSSLAPRIMLIASASSAAGIQSVEFLVNGNSLALLTAPNNGSNWTYLLDPRTMPAGVATLVARATDNASETAEAQRQITINNPPVVTLQSPVDGAIVAGQLQVRGTFADDAPGTELTVHVGDVQVLQTSTSPFAMDYPLAGLPGGEYTISFRARDSGGQQTSLQRTFFVTPNGVSATLVASPIQRLLGSGNGTVVYQNEQGAFVRRAAGNETALNIPAGAGGWQEWHVDGARVVAASSSVSLHDQVYSFDAAGNAINISQQHNSGDRNANLTLRGSWLTWLARTSDSYWIYNFDTAAALQVSRPTDAIANGGDQDLAVAPGAEQLFFSAQTGGSGVASIWDIYRYRLADGSTQRLTGGDAMHMYPRTDGVRIAWRKAPTGQVYEPYQLVTTTVANPTAQSVVSSTMSTFQLADGVLAWLEGPYGQQTLKVSAATTTTLASNTTLRLYSVAHGHVIFGEAGKLYAWSNSAGKRLLLDALPMELMQDDDAIYLTTGQYLSGSLHRIDLP